MTIPVGLYRTTQAHPFDPAAIPANALVYVGDSRNGGGQFVVRPGATCTTAGIGENR